MRLYGSKGGLCGIALLATLLGVMPRAEKLQVGNLMQVTGDNVVDVGSVVPAAFAVLLDDLAAATGTLDDDSPE
jgi:hypothetical protein